jgi:hypothetical protein
LHFKKHFSLNTSTDEGITISSNPVPANAPFSIRDNFDSDSIVTDESNPHSKKHSSPKISTDRGRATNRRLVFENILVSIRSNIDTFSKTCDLNCR